MSFNDPAAQRPIINHQDTDLNTSDIDYSINQSTSTSNPSTFHHHQLDQTQQQQPLHLNHSIDTSDPGFQVPSTEGLGLLPPPVAYKGFSNPDLIGSCSNRFQPPIRSTESSDLTQSLELLLPIPSDLSQTCFLNSNYHHQPWTRIDSDPCVMRTATDLLPAPTSSVTESDQLAFNQLVHNPSISNSSAPSSTTFPYYDPGLPSSHSSSSLPSISMSTYPSPHHSNEHQPGNEMAYYPNPSSKLITPPPLFDQSEQDLFSSFLNIFGDFNGEWDFEPQGMPEGMPVLGELKRRLEAEHHDEIRIEGEGGKDWIGTEEMEREVNNRLKISESDSFNSVSSRPPTRLSSHSPSRTRQSGVPPSLLSRPSTSSLIDLPSENEEMGRKKAKLKETTQFIQPMVNSSSGHELPIGLPGAFGDEDDIEMTQLREEPVMSGSNDWELTRHSIPTRFNDSNFPQPHQFQHRLPSQVSSLPLPFSGIIPNPPTSSSNTTMNITSHSNNPNESNKKTAIKENERNEDTSSKGIPNKTTHIVSEQKRRNAIQGGFGSLVEILRLGELQSGITIGIIEKSNGNEKSNGTSNVKVKSGRGRGRRGEIETGASKSVVIERAVEYVKWMRFGNQALLKEVERLESIIRSDGLEI
ncbi:uncharacterized protein MELLADRAFT_68779 [Melampsora larici-populina 98AG31]|uniref:BHLH domain-containing protein n=1 Tax=Melampsora larici-populina (strain 98AG31 / pathotype 3-4-7) TaxID=747676 RepID=F4S849_MELLP|nr:uncharacterized protein MELLADRAFT_68779 [Melampsora larici-populina 98AG31]EGF99181.1 hypothetical protein MELLADRAFT_68779 [Melampsora larici-populina 98AG31]